jgi:hypothetical protein
VAGYGDLEAAKVGLVGKPMSLHQARRAVAVSTNSNQALLPQRVARTVRRPPRPHRCLASPTKTTGCSLPGSRQYQYHDAVQAAAGRCQADLDRDQPRPSRYLQTENESVSLALSSATLPM